MRVIICAKYKKNLSRTVDATERTRFSKSRSNDLEGIGQGQRSSHVTHLLMLVVTCTKYGKNPSWTVDATGRTGKVNRQTDGQTDRQTGWIQYTPLTSLRGCIKISALNKLHMKMSFAKWQKNLLRFVKVYLKFLSIYRIMMDTKMELRHVNIILLTPKLCINMLRAASMNHLP